MCSNVRSCAVGLLALIVLLTSAVASMCAEESVGKLAVRDRHLTASVKCLTSVTGKDMAQLAVGQAIKVTDLSNDGASNVMDAAKMVFHPEAYAERFPNLPAGAYWELAIHSGFSVSFESAALGSSKLVVSLSKFVPGLELTPGADSTISKLAISNPPSFDSIMSQAPANDGAARVAFLRSAVSDLLKPLGSCRLSACSDMPFEFADFDGQRMIDVKELNDAQRTWVSQLYTQYAVRAVELGRKMKDFSVSGGGSAVVEGVSADWIKNAPPTWKELGDATIKLNLEYTLLILPKGVESGCLGGGWTTPNAQ